MAIKYEAPAVIQATRILKLLSRFKYTNSSLTEISNKLEINRSTCLRILKSLESEKFVSYNPTTKRYKLGPYLVVLGHRAYDQLDYLALAKKYLKRLANETTMTSVLIERTANDKLVYMAKEEIDEGLRVNVSVGSHFEMLEISYGMWYLAYMDESERQMYLSKGLKQKTSKTITNPEEYLERVELAKEQGYLFSDDEYVEGICGASAPIFKSNGELGWVIACIGLSSMPQEKISYAIKTIQTIAREFNEMIAMQGM